MKKFLCILLIFCSMVNCGQAEIITRTFASKNYRPLYIVNDYSLASVSLTGVICQEDDWLELEFTFVNHTSKYLVARAEVTVNEVKARNNEMVIGRWDPITPYETKTAYLKVSMEQAQISQIGDVHTIEIVWTTETQSMLSSTSLVNKYPAVTFIFENDEISKK